MTQAASFRYYDVMGFPQNFRADLSSRKAFSLLVCLCRQNGINFIILYLHKTYYVTNKEEI